ncbi:GNAT family N-acetyltransferase [Streptomyces sp. IBSBF 2435]|uniref:GNAT family N-acetyltransferase n=1 Tax=Streptomyces sp. IBSBF 2435 TaxID=2903531 RepID=UPI002FDBC6A6
MDGRAARRSAGRPEAVTAFADAWCARTGTRWHIAERTRVHALGELTPRRPGPPGAAGTAVAADRDLLLRWSREMAAEIGVPLPGGDAVVDDVIAHGRRALWRTPDGEAVAMAGRSVEIRGAIRVVAVYTPPEHRGKGYGGAAVTAVSQAALDAGAHHVLLVTDLANPVSNGLYRRLGYRPVRDSLHVAFTAAGAGEAGPST